MRRLASFLLIATIGIAAGTGCKSWGKNKTASTDPYDAGLSAEPLSAYPAYKPAAPMDTYAAPAYPSESAIGGMRYHTVQKKETLYAIARQYYNGDHTRWKEIYEANRAEISDPNMIRVGQRLMIP